MSLLNAMSVDVEDYFQVSAFDILRQRNNWSSMRRRVDQNTRRILDLFECYNAKATFFTLGWVAEREPKLIRAIVEAGHEVASHGFYHQRVTQLSPRQFYQDVSRTKSLLEDLTGVAVTGYRAPSYSIDRSMQWAYEALQKAGYNYSSSVYPVAHDHYGDRHAPRFAYQQEDLQEIPITTARLYTQRLPMGGGGFFRLYPYLFSKWGIRQVNEVDNQPAVFYFHPWEIDPGQPRQTGLPWKSQFRHYLNLQYTEPRLRTLLRDFRWGRMDRVFASKS